jgi:hypothetical protein
MARTAVRALGGAGGRKDRAMKAPARTALLCLASLLFLAPPVAGAARSDSAKRPQPRRSQAKLLRKPADRAPGLSVLGVTLNRTPIGRIRRMLGRAPLQSNGLSGPLGASFLCYEGKDGTRLLLVSYESGGAGFVGGLQLLAKGEPPLWDEDDRGRGAQISNCTELKKLSIATPLAGGLRLGATQAELRARLGDPARGPDDAPATATADSAGRVPAAAIAPPRVLPPSGALHWFWDRSVRRGLEDYHHASYVSADLREDRAVALRTGETISN